MSELIATLNTYVWSPPLVFLCLGAGVYFSIRSRFVQVRQIPTMIKQLVGGEKSDDGVSSFQALAISLAGRVGTGNIAGVATAIAFGGPGALFWMWVMAFLGASTSFVECTLGQIYKERDRLTGEYRGGPAYYFSRAWAHTRFALAGRVYGLAFAAVTVLACGLLMPMVQANSMAVAMDGAWGVQPWVAAVGIVIVLAFVIIGGVKRIATFATVVVPFMAIVYIAAALIVMAFNASAVPEVFKLVIASAFGLEAGIGGAVGAAIMWGVKRGIYSNEAGQGTGPHAAAAAEVSHPAKQGLVQAFAVYVDTLFVCSATGFLILSTGAYRVFDGDDQTAPVIADGGALTGDPTVGPAYPQQGFDTVFNGAGASFIAISLAFFCFTTIVAYYYMAETNLRFLLGRAATFVIPGLNSPLGRTLTILLQALILVSVAMGAVSEAKDAWAMGDLGVGLMAWLNVLGILVLQNAAFAALRDFERQQKLGIDPQFDPAGLGIVGADFWDKRAEERRTDPVDA
ncbi:MULTISPECIES: alanine/glycine:cation symporter family protein [Tsukamurella]|uniref:Alanine/glycine:cation symporter family protein n=1 Tax=Tsukamurella strandjordii TaxID=147577 RepID=A0AA90N918_9ACTN|nr:MULTISPECIES: alanine/glycine:cation symporter family protein [Tsukamurella]MDP0397861.1 alanine/glycine:cation symporter family protein [Tsukamurella strandjordii]GIZ99305.1 sodium:alanine symporter [Tsukamurella sp. TY48]